MKATNLRLPDDLQQRIAQLVEGTDRTAHSFMIDAIEQAARREELRRRAGTKAELAEEAANKIGKVYDAAEAFHYFESRAKGKRAKRPRLKSWRRSR